MQPNTKMSSGQATFDLKAARQMCAELPGRDKLPLPDRIDREERVLRLFPAALDEIGRLRKALALKTEQHKGQAHVIGSYLGMLADFNELNESQTKRIAELEESLQRERAMAFSKIQRQRHAIVRLSEAKRERGKALVEERARRICHVPGDPVGHWARYEKVVVDEAREQLVHKGKL